MKNAVNSMVLAGMIILGSIASQANQIQKSDTVFGKVDAKSKIRNQINAISKCGYYLTKGAA